MACNQEAIKNYQGAGQIACSESGCGYSARYVESFTITDEKDAVLEVVERAIVTSGICRQVAAFWLYGGDAQ
jgi:hypothetical protein